MLWTVAVVLFVLWALGFFAFHVGGGIIHALIVVAVIILLFQLISGRRRLV
ncbi:MAG TPA: lmo0937 family membrane protein [Thermoanaerobaculia bacterium]|nr:lmo0937 family membrane protein [Thermoanaerobaculia bacterium]